MDRVIYTFNKTLNGMQASTKIARYLSTLLDLPIVTAGEGVHEMDPKILIIVNGAYQYAGTKGLANLAVAIEQAEQIVWVQNDYTIRPPKHVGTAESPFRKAFRNRYERGRNSVHFWTTIPDMLLKMGYVAGRMSAHVNWNALSVPHDGEPPEFPRDVSRQSRDALIYYGAFRRERQKHFFHWFVDVGTDMDVIVSTQQVAKFEDNYDEIVVMETVEDLHAFLRVTGGMGLYLEDGRSHRQFHSPANRFYEMLSAGMPIVFDSSCWKTFRTAGYSITDFHTEKPSDVPNMIKRGPSIAREQHERWWDRAVDERKNLPRQIADLWSGVIG